MELVVRKNDLLKELSLLQGIVERKNTIPILANVLLEASKNQVCAARDGSRCRPAEPLRGDGHQAGHADAAGEEAVRDRERAAGHRDPDRRGQGRQERHDRRRSIRVADADAAGERVSDAAPGRRHRRGVASRAGAEAHDFAHALRDHERRHALLPERRAARAAAGFDEHGRDRRPPAGLHQRA